MNYTLKRSLRKTISVEIKSNAEIIVRAPKRAPRKFIDGFIESNTKWIEQKLKKIQIKPYYQNSFKPENGHYIYYLGTKYSIKEVQSEKELIRFNNDNLEISSKQPSDSNIRLQKFIKKSAKLYLSTRINEISEDIKLPFKNLRITSAKTRWGSCSYENNINLSFRLMMLPEWVIDYVIIHELVHTKIKNHSPKFWKKVSDYTSNTERSKRWIKEHRHKLPF